MRRLYLLALLPLLMAAAPPANVPMANGSPRAVTPVAVIDANGDQITVFGGGSGGGGGTGDASASNQTTQITAANLTNTRIGDITAPATGSVNDRLNQIYTRIGAANFQAGNSIGNTAFGATQSGTWNVGLNAGTNIVGNFRVDQTTPGTTNGVVVNSSALPTGAATSALQTTGNTSLATVAGTVGTVGSAVSTTVQVAGARDSAGNARAVLTSPSGGLLPGQAAPVSTRNTLTASTATSIDIARSARLLTTIQLETSPTANVFLCFTQTTTCSATTYDILIASGSASGTIYTAPFGSQAAVYAFSTGTPIVNVTSWIAQ